MYNHNISSYSINIKKVNTFEEFDGIIKDIFGDIDYLFSFYFETSGNSYKLLFKLSDNCNFNTISVKSNFGIKLWNAICEERTPIFEQPSIDILVQSYDNFFNKLSARFHRDWPFVDFDDFKQLCYLALLKLYNANYMINKNLLQKACTNEMLMYLRKQRIDTETVSLFGKVMNKDSQDVPLYTVLVDEKQIYQMQDDEEREYNETIFKNLKEYLIPSIGERMFNKLLHDYGNKCTDDISRARMIRLKNKLKNKGITITFFENNGGKNVT